MELTWNNAMEPNDSLTENESSTRIEEDFLVMSSSELQYYPQQWGLSVSGTHISLAAMTLVAFEQKVEIKLLQTKLQSNWKMIIGKFW